MLGKVVGQQNIKCHENNVNKVKINTAENKIQ
jgi:hypothetical protein